MNKNKNVRPEQESDLNQKEHLDKRNDKTKETDSTERSTKQGDLNPTNKISENIHILPAEEQQFEGNV
jgi:hypothetical protein